MTRMRHRIGFLLALLVGLCAHPVLAQPEEMFTFAVFGAHDESSEPGAGIMARAMDTMIALSPDLAFFAGGAPLADYPGDAGVRAVVTSDAAGFDHKWAHFSFLDAKAGPAAGMTAGRLTDELAATDARSLYLFVESPIWRTDPERWGGLEQVLLDDGRRATVFSVSDKYSRDDSRPSSNIHLYSLGPTGSFSNLDYEHDSFQQLTLVTVRGDGDRVASLPIDAGDPPIEPAPGWVFEELDAFRGSDWAWLDGGVRIDTGPGAESRFELHLFGMAPRAMEYSVGIDVDQGWAFSNRALRGSLEPGQEISFPITATAPAIGSARPDLRVTVRARFPLGQGGEQAVTRVLSPRLTVVGIESDGSGGPGGWARLNGRAAARIDLDRAPSGAFTIEMWSRGDEPRVGRAMALAGLGPEGAFGLFWSDGGEGEVSLPVGFVRTSAGVFEARASEAWAWGEWTHVALCFDGSTLSLFVNGQTQETTGVRGTPILGPSALYIGADAGDDGRARDYFTGEIDDVRLSGVARYSGPFSAPEQMNTDADTLGLWRFDRRIEGLLPDSSRAGNHAWAVGGITIQQGPRE